MFPVWGGHLEINKRKRIVKHLGLCELWAVFHSPHPPIPLKRNVIRQSYLINLLLIRPALCNTRQAQWKPESGFLGKLFSDASAGPGAYKLFLLDCTRYFLITPTGKINPKIYLIRWTFHPVGLCAFQSFGFRQLFRFDKKRMDEVFLKLKVWCWFCDEEEVCQKYEFSEVFHVCCDRWHCLSQCYISHRPLLHVPGCL